MALLLCPDCEHQVSDQAPACPKCGRPMPQMAKQVVRLPRRGFICQDCGEVGFPQRVAPGSFLIEVVLWCFFIVPGLIYTLWRSSNRRAGCPKCKGNMVKIRSPRGQLLAQQFNPHVQIIAG